jgi:hypothetical protein
MGVVGTGFEVTTLNIILILSTQVHESRDFQLAVPAVALRIFAVTTAIEVTFFPYYDSPTFDM